MHSPLSSPSVPLRAMAYAHSSHALPHLPRSSYFSPEVQASSPHMPPRPALAAAYNNRHPAQPGSPTCSSYVPPSSPRAAPASARPLMPSRRESYRESAIPIRPSNIPLRSSADMSAVNEAETGRRRPSFKIDLPPRPIPVEILHSVHTSSSTPYPAKAGTHVSLAQKTANNTALNAHTPPVHAHHYAAAPVDAAGNVNSHAAVNSARGPLFREDAEEGYIILQASPDMETLRHKGHGSQGQAPSQWHDLASPLADPWSGAGIIGLGYTLNKLRAPTPWIRGKADEGEWLTSSDVDDIEMGMAGLGMA